MSRRAVTAPKTAALDQDEASSDSDLGIKSKPQAKSKSKDAKPRRKSDRKATVVKEIPATQVPDESADEFDLQAPNGRAVSVPTDAPKITAVPAKASSVDPSKPPQKRLRKAIEVKTAVPETQLEDAEGEAQASSNFGRTTQAPKQPRPAKRKAKLVPPAEDDAAADDLAEQKQQKPSKGRKDAQKPTSRKRSSSASELDENGSDRSAKRRLDVMSKRFDSLELRYEQLKDVAVKEAETNYDELKKRTDERQKAAEGLISNLRTELAVQSTAAAEAKSLQDKVSEVNALNEKLKAETKSLETNLKSAQAEAKTLQAKFAATRANSEQRAVPDSALKKSVNAKQPLASGGVDAQKLAVKEQLYGDLTGLIIRDVKRREDEDGKMDVYDCIQTGRNGTLHFHLAVPNPQPTGVPYGEADLEYTPLLDPSNDRILIEILPDYLTDEILFPQKEAQRFYGRINEFIMKSKPAERPLSEGDDQEVDAVGGEEA